ncbi:MAG TPA: hypothetical protein VJZ26_08695, partial [Blastocatellia bacterium]|nr:hypothetical protein [Blastocatellia bacterium]
AALLEQTEGSRIIPIREKLSDAESAATERHLRTCSRCGHEYRLFALGHAAMDAVASKERIEPDEDFFKALRARIARGDEAMASERADESWAAALLPTARQMIPAMAMLLLLIIGATLLWSSAPAKWNTAQASDKVPRRERVVLPDLYEYPAPTADDVLETLVAVEEKKNGK